MLSFNWGMFWALLAAFAVRGVYKDAMRYWRISANETDKFGNANPREITLRDIWELL